MGPRRGKKINRNQCNCLLHIDIIIPRVPTFRKGFPWGISYHLLSAIGRWCTQMRGCLPLTLPLNLIAVLVGHNCLWPSGRGLAQPSRKPLPNSTLNASFHGYLAHVHRPETEGCENSTRTALILKGFAALRCLWNCLHIIRHLADFSLVKCINTNRRLKNKPLPLFFPKKKAYYLHHLWQ